MRQQYFILIIILCSTFSSYVFALQPPTKEQLAKYKKHGILKEKIEQAYKRGNHKISPELLYRSTQYLNKTNKNKKLPAEDFSPRNADIATKGNLKTFTLLIAFPDAPAPAHQSVEVMQNHIYGDGLPERYPRESLTNFYQRSSYQQLNLIGKVFDWYTTPYLRTTVLNEIDVIKDALKYYEQQGVDFSEYDNDGDGDIDYLSVIWTGERGGWGGLWWGFYSSYFDADFEVSGKTVGSYSWQWLSNDNEVDDFNPTVLLHETGHAFGLPDYYDYDIDVGPALEFPVSDMMKNNVGDHNAFSKFMLGWIEPEIVGEGTKTVELMPSSSSQDALVVMPSFTLEKGLSEYFIVQSRDDKINDINMLGDGLLVWHVDATSSSDGFGFIQNNSYSDHALIKLLSPDENNYYQPGDELTPLTTPNSVSYRPDTQSVKVTDITKSENFSLTATIIDIPIVTISNLIPLELLSPQKTILVTVDSQEPVSTVKFYENDVYVGEDTDAPYSFNFIGNEATKGKVVNIRVEALTSESLGWTSIDVLKSFDEPSLLVIDFNTPSALIDVVKLFKKPVLELTDVPIVSPEDVPAIFLVTNLYQQPITLTNEQFQRLKTYVNLGGNLYYENIHWYWERSVVNQQFSQLGIESTARWSQTQSTIAGADNSVAAGLSYEINDSYFLFNELTGSVGFNEVKPLWNIEEAGFSHAVTNKIGLANIIATTGKFNWFPEYLKVKVIKRYLDFMALDSTLKPVTVTIEKIAQDSSIESYSNVQFEIKRSYDDGTDSQVTIALESDSAIADIDYEQLSYSVVSFAENELTKSFILELNDDLLADGDKELYIKISGDNVSNVNSQISVFIEDNESRGLIQFEQSAMTVEENGSSFDLSIKRIEGTDDEIPFTLTSKNSSAVSGTDYESIDVNLTFSVGETEKILTVNIIDNNIYESNKTFDLQLISDYLVGGSQNLKITINNDESPPPPPPAKEKSSGGGTNTYMFSLYLLLFFFFRHRAKFRGLS